MLRVGARRGRPSNTTTKTLEEMQADAYRAGVAAGWIGRYEPARQPAELRDEWPRGYDDGAELAIERDLD